jgi:hypothetical protein
MVRPVLVASLLVVIASLISPGHAAGSDAAAPIATDRLAVTDSSVVVPARSLQAENGFADTASQGQRTFDGPETLLRFGVTSKTEFRLTTPDYFGQSAMSSGSGDLAVGMKRQLGPTGGFDVSVGLIAQSAHGR